MQSQTKQIGLFAGLVLLMAATRYNHFGSAVALPDASLAVFLMAGFILARQQLPALAAFVFLLLEAGGIDYYAIVIKGVSGWCVSPAYWFLIPTYGVMFGAGRWFAPRVQNSLKSAVEFSLVAWLASSVAFFISNTSFYLLSGKFTDINALQYVERVAQYYQPYISSSLMYLAIAAGLYALTHNLKQPAEVTH